MNAHAKTDNPHTRAIADFVSGLTYEQIPAAVRERIKLLMLDSLGCAIYGANLEWCRILRGTLEKLDATRSTSIWGTNARLSSDHAALVNGTQVQGFELDDVHRKAVLHVGAVTLPALIAVAESHAQLSGLDFLTAAVAGYEIGPRVGLCMGQEHIGQGWHSGATVGIFSAAAGAARALKLDPEQTVHALGIAGTQSSGLMAAQYGAMVKRMHAGRAAQSGLYGALLAANGFTGIVDVFEAPYGGFCTTFSRSQDRFNLSALSAGLGQKFETMGIALKFYSCVGSNHTTLDAVPTSAGAGRSSSMRSKRSSCMARRSPPITSAGPTNPQDLTAAQLNLPFCVATLLIEGDVFVDEFTPDCVDDAARIALSRKVKRSARSGDHGARRRAPPQGTGRGAFPRRHGRTRNARGTARQRAVIRQHRRHRRQVPQTDTRRHGGEAAGCPRRSRARGRGIGGQPRVDRAPAAVTRHLR